MLHNRLVWLGIALSIGLSGCSLFQGQVKDVRPSLNAYEALPADDAVSVVSITDKNYVGTIKVGHTPVNLVVNPRSDREYLYTANSNDGTVSFVNLRSGQQEQAVQAGSGPWGIDITPYSGKQWIVVANTGDGTVTRIDPTSRATQVRQVTQGVHPHGVVCVPPLPTAALTAQVLDAYIISDTPATGSSGCQIQKINADGSMGAVTTIPGSVQLWKGAITPDGKTLLITDLKTSFLYRVQLSDMSVQNPIQLPANGYDVAITPDGKYAYVSIPVGPSSDTAQGEVSTVDLGSNTVISSVTVNNPVREANQPQALAVNSSGTELWVTLQNRLGYFSGLGNGKPGNALSVATYTANPGQSSPISDIAMGAGVQ